MKRQNSNQIITDIDFPLLLNLYKLEHLCLQLNIDLDYLLEIHSNRSKLVKQFQIKTGKKKKKRNIFAPSKEYKKLLKKINSLLQSKSIFREGVVGGIREKKIIDAVKKHCSKEAYYCVDLENFFPTINYKRIINVFLKASCSDEVAELFADLVSYNKMLPQGFPTSPIVSNIIASKLDIQQLSICKIHNLYRTRWIDDIVFSGRIKDLEKAIHKIDKSIKKNNFIKNIDKSRFHRRKNDPKILGLSLQKHKPYVPKSLIKKIDLILNSIIQFGFNDTYEIFKDEFKSKKSKEPKTIMLNSIEGKIRYIEAFNRYDSICLWDKYNSLK